MRACLDPQHAGKWGSGKARWTNHPLSGYYRLQGYPGFQAGDELRSKPKTQKLDVTGVFGMACRHEHPLKFLKRGEKLANTVFLLGDLKAMQGPNITTFLHYDIAFQLKPHLQKNSPDLMVDTQFAVPAFHAYDHDADCQTKKTHCLLATIHRLVLKRSFYCGLVRKYADGQTIAVRLSRKVRRTSARIKQQMNAYNGRNKSPQFPPRLEYRDILQQDHPV
ncbi:hypothetical protein J4Q44_G00187070 [Coregonus suidteri]|uniref:Uncharacterized protein n=1 Tax=Coregonus suidteri TaxID=861788 RepID=A0AAN8LEG8_9TELE